MKQLSERKIEAMDTLLEAIKEDYLNWRSTYFEEDDLAQKVREEMIQKFSETLSYTVGNKYIKVIIDRSVWGFVVNCENDGKFQDGDLLMAASWKAPARNFPRANIFKEYQVRWAGA